jgi:hypothetical protein
MSKAPVKHAVKVPRRRAMLQSNRRIFIDTETGKICGLAILKQGNCPFKIAKQSPYIQTWQGAEKHKQIEHYSFY